MKKRIKFLLISILVLVIAIVGVNQFTTKSEENDDLAIVVSADYPVTSELSEMVIESDLVVLGSYKNLDSTWNMARNPEDLSKEDTENYVEGRLYNFEIDKVIKGDSPEKTIKVNHRYSETLEVEETDAVIAPDGTIEKPATEEVVHEVVNKDPLFIEPNLGETYIVFLKKDHEMNNYYGAIEPFSIKFDKSNIAELQTNLKELNDEDFISTQKVDGKNIEIINDIETQVSDEISGMKLNDLEKLIKSFH